MLSEAWQKSKQKRNEILQGRQTVMARECSLETSSTLNDKASDLLLLGKTLQQRLLCQLIDIIPLSTILRFCIRFCKCKKSFNFFKVMLQSRGS